MTVAPCRGNQSWSLPPPLPLNGIKEQSIERFGFHRPARGRFCSGLAASDFTPTGHLEISPGAFNAPLPLCLATPKKHKVNTVFTDGDQLAAAFSNHGAVQRRRCHPPPPPHPLLQSTRTPSSTAIVESGDKIGICCSTRRKENTLGRKICGTFAAVQRSNRWRGAGCRAK